MFRQQHKEEFGRGEEGRGGHDSRGRGVHEYVHMVNVGNSNVMDVDHSKDVNKTEILVYPKKNPAAPNQQWRLEQVSGNKFFIVSALDANMVIDVPGATTKSGTKCILYQKSNGTPAQNQLWEWVGDTIQSAMGHNLVLAQHGGNDGYLITETKNGKPSQSWRQERS